jgi:hypothetical protein
MLVTMPAVPAAVEIMSVIPVGRIVRAPMVIIIVFVRSVRIVRIVVASVIVRFYPHTKAVIRFCLGNQDGKVKNDAPPVSPVPEANAGWVLIPFFGIVLLFFGTPWESDRIETAVELLRPADCCFCR